MSVPRLLVVSCVAVLFSIPGTFSSNAVTLGSIQIFDTHEWLAPRPTIYFHCQGENRTILPDVKEKHFLYIFKGEESWQPLTELPDKKCKRCGLYEMDVMKSDDIFDEWELCHDIFLDGYDVHYKEKEFNATFKCLDCAATFRSNADEKASDKKDNVAVVIIISGLVSVVLTIGVVSTYRYWRRRKREQDQARFLKLFEEGDDLEDELESF